MPKITISIENLNKIFLVLSMVPLLSPSGISINYSFVLLFLFSTFFKPKDLPFYVPLILFFAILSYMQSFIFGLVSSDYSIRQFFSFGAYCSFLMLLFVKVKIETTKIFEAVVLVCTIYSALVLYFTFFVEQLGFGDFRAAKSVLRQYLPDWPQRFPVLMMAAFLYTIIEMRKNKFYIAVSTLLGLCLFLTFTRAIYLSLFVALIYLTIFSLFRLKLSITKISIFPFVVMIASLSLFLFIPNDTLSNAFNIIVKLLGETYKVIVNLISGSTHLADMGSYRLTLSPDRHGGSEAERLYHWKIALQIWGESPVLGTGFAGIYHYSNLGSVHNQYLDVLMRTGVIGLILYIFLWIKLFTHFFYRPEICAGLIAIFSYGFFHETTKLPYLAVLFFVLCSKTIEERAKRMDN